MGKLPYVVITDSEETEGYISSVENFKKKNKNSSKCIRLTSTKKKLKIQNTPESLEKNSSSSCRSSRSVPSSRSSSRSSVPSNRSKSRSNTMLKQKLRGILKHPERESSEDEDEEPSWSPSQGRCLIGQVPRLPGQKPGPGGGLSFVLKKNVKDNSLAKQSSSSSRHKRASDKRLSQKRSF